MLPAQAHAQTVCAVQSRDGTRRGGHPQRRKHLISAAKLGGAATKEQRQAQRECCSQIMALVNGYVQQRASYMPKKIVQECVQVIVWMARGGVCALFLLSCNRDL